MEDRLTPVLYLEMSGAPPDEYAREFERIMLALARVGREIRQRNPSESQL